VSLRPLQAALAAVVLLHLLSSAGSPGVEWTAALWGLSPAAVWPRPVALLWSALALAALAMVPGFAARIAARHALDEMARKPGLTLRVISFPGRRTAALLAIAAAAIAWSLRERSHFFGDGALILRGSGLVAGSFTRAPLLVRPVSWWAGTAERLLGMSPETAIALLSVGAGAVAAYLWLRLAAALVDTRADRFALAVLGATSGATALFLGHVEYYAPLVPALLVWLLLAAHGLRGRWPLWPAWIGAACLFCLHVSSVALLPAQLLLAASAWRRGERYRQLGGALAGLATGAALLAFAGSGRGALGSQWSYSLRRYLAPYLDPGDLRHAYGFFDPAHARAVVNACLLVASLAAAVAVALVTARLLARRRRRSSAVQRPAADATRPDAALRRFLAVAALGCLALHAAFNHELGAYRDWDALAPHAFVYLAWAGVALCGWAQRPARPAAGATTVLLLAVAGAHQLVPWTALHTRAGAAEAHLRMVLRDSRAWSPHARGLLLEEFAIARRDRGDAAGALADYRAAAAAVPSDARYQLGIADMSMRLGDTAAAERHWEESLRLRPDYAPAHNNLAAFLARHGGDPERAHAHALAAVRAAPDNVTYLLTYAIVEMQRRNHEAARRTLERARALEPDSPRLRACFEELARREAARR
jgi:tetratricopeptide (TPR) repeat protein